jgi:ABC-type antimicrobial peptide transport system permease subunit
MNIVRRFIGEGLRLSVIGLGIGLPLSLVALRFAQSEPDLLPPMSLSQVALIAGAGVLAVAMTAAWIPARRAAGVDPALVLRGD